MKLKQLSLFVENKPGSLSGPCRALAAAGVNLVTFSIADSQEFGIFRFIVREWEKALDLLEKGGWVAKVTDVVAVEVPDQPGGLAGILEILEKAGLNVEYMYAFTLKRNDKGVLVFRFDDPDAALRVLRAGGISVVGSSELEVRLGGLR